nr:juvenile hormone epoxide hydrolase 1-like [Onthophagus taurus]
MGICGKLTLILLTGLAVFIGMKLNALNAVPEVPKLEDTWWGPGDPKKVDPAIKTFKIDVPEKVLDDLKSRLQHARPFVTPLENSQQNYGINSKLLQEIVDFWKTKYDWRQREKFLNKFPQFITNIQGLNIHYLHVKPQQVPSTTKVLPLLLLHGWPGSVREFYEIIPLLTTPRKGQNFVFEVIAPSLPGYGFSEGASKPGLGPPQMSIIFKNLMKRIGFEKFYVQGGDWGSVIVANMAVLIPDNLLGVHSNMCFSLAPSATLKHLFWSIYPSAIVEKEHEHKMYPIGKIYENILLEFGYMHIQSTKPDTVGVGLNDSPVGLAAYILEKFTTWTNPAWKNQDDGGLKGRYMYADLLDNVMIYWVTNSITTSMRLYSEQFNKATMEMKLGNIPTDVPYACARFEYELGYMPDCLLSSTLKNIIHSSHIKEGGHFAAFEVPKLLADDIWVAVGKMEKFHADKKQEKN